MFVYEDLQKYLLNISIPLSYTMKPKMAISELHGVLVIRSLLTYFLLSESFFLLSRNAFVLIPLVYTYKMTLPWTFRGRCACDV